MVLRLPLGSVRRFAALLLLLGVLLGGAVDAIACEPATEAAAAVTKVTVGERQSGDDQLPRSDHGGVCTHGHCHHGVSAFQPVAAWADVTVYHEDHPLPRERHLASIVPDSLERPPRA
jgi:hypothetical protein